MTLVLSVLKTTTTRPFITSYRSKETRAGFDAPRKSALRTGLFLLLLEERNEGDTRNLDDLETDTGNITLSMTAAAETRNQNLPPDNN